MSGSEVALSLGFIIARGLCISGRVDTSPKCIDREVVVRRRVGTR